jgi:hypothetical protein
MILCPNNHDNLDALSYCRVCGLPLLNLRAEFASLAESLINRAEMGCPSPKVVLVGLGKVGAGLIDISKADYADRESDCSFLAIDTDGTASTTGSGRILRLRLGTLAPNAGTFCGIGEAITKSDPNLAPVLRKAGLSHEDGSQVVFFAAGIGGGIGSAPSVLVEKCRQLNPGCHTLALVVVPGVDESFHNHLNAYYGLSRLLEDGSRQSPDLIVAVNYDRIKMLRGVGAGGQELTTESLLAALTSLFVENVNSQYIAEVIRINRSVGVKLVVPCLALGRSIEIFGSLANILESAIAYPANHVSRRAVLTCHLLLRLPGNHATGFEEETVNKELWALVRRHLPGVKATSSSITYSDEQHDRVEACILLGGDSATSALFGESNSFTVFQRELDRQIGWQTYGLDQQGVEQAGDILTRYNLALEQSRGERKEKRAKTRQASPKISA